MDGCGRSWAARERGRRRKKPNKNFFCLLSLWEKSPLFMISEALWKIFRVLLFSLFVSRQTGHAIRRKRMTQNVPGTTMNGGGTLCFPSCQKMCLYYAQLSCKHWSSLFAANCLFTQAILGGDECTFPSWFRCLASIEWWKKLGIFLMNLPFADRANMYTIMACFLLHFLILETSVVDSFLFFISHTDRACLNGNNRPSNVLFASSFHDGRLSAWKWKKAGSRDKNRSIECGLVGPRLFQDKLLPPQFHMW